MNSFNQQRTLAMMTGFERYSQEDAASDLSGRDGTSGTVRGLVRPDRAALCQARQGETAIQTAANVSDVAVLPDLLHGEETRVWGDVADQGQTGVIRDCAPRARDFTQRRCRYKGQIVDEVAWAKNRTKSKERAKVEHVFQVLKLKFGFMKVRYRGLKKNAQRLFVICALVNLFVTVKSYCWRRRRVRFATGGRHRDGQGFRVRESH